MVTRVSSTRNFLKKSRFDRQSVLGCPWICGSVNGSEVWQEIGLDRRSREIWASLGHVWWLRSPRAGGQVGREEAKS